MGLRENMSAESVEELAVREAVLAKEDQTIREAIQAMRHRDLGCVIIVDDDQKPIGMFTESMLTQLIATNPRAIEDPVVDHAAKHWPQVKASDPIVSVLESLELKNIRFLSVVDEEGRIASLTGQKGLMEYVADHFPGQVMVQRVGQTPFLHQREGA